jgi:hypothetical protein
MKMRWYQHKEQGANSMTSLKNRLPSDEIAAIIQQMKIIVQFVLDA